LKIFFVGNLIGEIATTVSGQWVLQTHDWGQIKARRGDVLYVEGLKHNLLSISQLCDKGCQVIFKTNSCEICLPNTKEVMLIGKRINNVYLLDVSSPYSNRCLLSKDDESWLRHRRIARIHMNHVPNRSSGVMTCLASDYVGRAQQGTWTKER